MRPIPDTRYAVAGGVHLAYQVTGEGPPDLLYMPHWASHVELMWEEPSSAAFLDHLASFTRLIRFDRRGVGLSDPVPLPELPTLEAWVDDIAAVLDAAGSERAAVVAADTAAFTAIMFAASHPERVSALVLVNATARVRRALDYPIGLPDRVAERFLADLEGGWGTEAATIEALAPTVAGNAQARAWVSRYQRATASPATILSMTRMLLDSDVRGVLSAVKVPTLVLHRAGDRYLRPDHGRYLSAHIPGARYVEVPGSGHSPDVGDPAPLLDAIKEFLTGEPWTPESHRILATVVITDIVNSTERAAALGDARWCELLARHDEVVRRQLRRFDGREVKTTGDGFLATFNGGARAIRCACAIRDGVRSLGIDVRVGVHAGEVELVEDDVRGLAVHVATRVADLAGPGDVFVSGTLKDLVAGSGIPFQERGIHSLRGVPGAWPVFAVAS